MSPEILEHLKRGHLMSEKKDEAHFSNPGRGGERSHPCLLDGSKGKGF
ncbi:hypothetical protein LEMLEM_LOCUS20011 [Lemmus lemmus]